ncbi:histidine kinase [Methylophaga thalassica]|uniref:Histidine kinase n=1 Tax=Methylophaga thalassica TaxID=40223 RepID=A0ABQ5TV94_9GAMM|nr:sensor histidine kinase [Methylophaga thalassica]GLP98750.1 histidine kinase [Methylophaga thalassica]
MNLQLQLFVRILIIAIICIIGSTWYVLYQTNQQALSEAESTATRIEHQIRQQLLQMFQRYDFSQSFPDIGLWQKIESVPGSCTQFLSRTQSRQRSLCNATQTSNKNYPIWFGHFYAQFFNPGVEVKRSVSFNAIKYGTILVTLNVDIETARAWHNLQAALGVLVVTILALCCLVFITINRMLKPAKDIVSGLEKMRAGALSVRLPDFDIAEWKRTSHAINALVSTQQNILAENKQLSIKIMNTQEEEHRYISRELHDEFGQCLAGINAVTTSVSQTAKSSCPELVDEIQSIRHITAHMMSALRDLLTRLRPAELDELGLETSLKQLIKSWNQRSSGKTNYVLSLSGSINDLPETLAVHVYRIVQECLTNIAKHASAENADVVLDIQDGTLLSLIIKDDGIADLSAFSSSNGLGLLGIHERVAALGGDLSLDTQTNGGLVVTIILPMNPKPETKL